MECKFATSSKKRGRKKGYRDALLEKLSVLENMLKPFQGEGSQNGGECFVLLRMGSIVLVRDGFRHASSLCRRFGMPANSVEEGRG